MKENIPFPEKIINWLDIVRCVGEVALHAVTDHFRYPTPSEHFRNEPKPQEVQGTLWNKE